MDRITAMKTVYHAAKRFLEESAAGPSAAVLQAHLKIVHTMIVEAEANSDDPVGYCHDVLESCGNFVAVTVTRATVLAGVLADHGVVVSPENDHMITDAIMEAIEAEADDAIAKARAAVVSNAVYRVFCALTSALFKPEDADV